MERKYQDQVRQLQQELDKEREAGAAQASRLRTQLEDLQADTAREETRLAEKVAADQKVWSFDRGLESLNQVYNGLVF